MSRLSSSVRSGAIFRSSGGAVPPAGIACRPSVQRPAQQLGQRFAALKGAQARRVGRRDVDHQIRRQGSQPADADHVIGGGIDGFLVLADIGADQPRPPAPRLKPSGDHVQPVIVEAVAVDHRPGFRHPEDARAGIARLRARRHAADFDKAEALGQHGVGHFRVLVEAGGEPDRIGEVQPPDDSTGGSGRPASGSAAPNRFSTPRRSRHGRFPGPAGAAADPRSGKGRSIALDAALDRIFLREVATQPIAREACMGVVARLGLRRAWRRPRRVPAGSPCRERLLNTRTPT